MEPVCCARVHDTQEALEASLVREVVLLAPSEVPPSEKKMELTDGPTKSKSGAWVFLLSKHVTGVAKVVELLGNGGVLALEPSLLQGSKSAALHLIN